MNFSGGKSLSLLTSGTLLLATLTPPPRLDVHAGGDAPHSHVTRPEIGHHHHGHSHQQEGTACAAVPHMHLCLLFFDFTLPQRDDSDNGSDTPPQLLPVATNGSALSHAVAFCDSLRILDVAIDAKPTAPSPVSLSGGGATPRARGLLCDGARCARTGVLLV